MAARSGSYAAAMAPIPDSARAVRSRFCSRGVRSRTGLLAMAPWRTSQPQIPDSTEKHWDGDVPAPAAPELSSVPVPAEKFEAFAARIEQPLRHLL